MDKTITRQEADDALQTACKELSALQSDLPKFEALVKENEQVAETLRRERAEPGRQIDAKTRVTAARELLEQHRADVQTAQAEVARLELLAAREQTLQEMVKHALEAKRQRQVLESALEAANAAFLKHIEKVDGAWIGMSQARNSFLDAGGRLSQAFNVLHYPVGWSNEKVETEGNAGEAILEELKARGVDLNDVLMVIGDDKRRSVFDLNHPREIVQPKPFAWMIHQARQVFRRHKHGL